MVTLWVAHWVLLGVVRWVALWVVLGIALWVLLWVALWVALWIVLGVNLRLGVEAAWKSLRRRDGIKRVSGES